MTIEDKLDKVCEYMLDIVFELKALSEDVYNRSQTDIFDYIEDEIVHFRGEIHKNAY